MMFRMTRCCGFIAATLSAVVFSHVASVQAQAVRPTPSAVMIGDNSGGRIGDFVALFHEYRSAGSQIHFSGYCDSACTLLLALPRSQTCISSGAVFRFHAPSAGSARVVNAARKFILSRYPGWVRSWIANNSGLTTQLISMDYSYASKFMRTCNQVASR